MSTEPAPTAPVKGPTLKTADGVALATRCWFSDASTRGAVVLAHGFTGNKDDARVVMYASALHVRGFDVVAYDGRGHGRSGGWCTLGDLERYDVAAAVELAKTRSSTVVVVGASMGAVAALSYAARASDIAGVVAVSSPSEWRLPIRVRSITTACLARTRVGRSFAHRTMHVRIAPWTSPESPRSLAARVRCQLVAVHGKRDPIIPASKGLGQVLEGDPRISTVLVPAMGHAFDPVGLDPICDAVDRVIELVDRAALTPDKEPATFPGGASGPRQHL